MYVAKVRLVMALPRLYTASYQSNDDLEPQHLLLGVVRGVIVDVLDRCEGLAAFPPAECIKNQEPAARLRGPGLRSRGNGYLRQSPESTIWQHLGKL